MSDAGEERKGCGGTRGEIANGEVASLGGDQGERWTRVIEGGMKDVPPARGSSFVIERHACGRAGVCARGAGSASSLLVVSPLGGAIFGGLDLKNSTAVLDRFRGFVNQALVGQSASARAARSSPPHAVWPRRNPRLHRWRPRRRRARCWSEGPGVGSVDPPPDFPPRHPRPREHDIGRFRAPGRVSRFITSASGGCGLWG